MLKLTTAILTSTLVTLASAQAKTEDTSPTKKESAAPSQQKGTDVAKNASQAKFRISDQLKSQPQKAWTNTLKPYGRAVKIAKPYKGDD